MHKIVTEILKIKNLGTVDLRVFSEHVLLNLSSGPRSSYSGEVTKNLTSLTCFDSVIVSDHLVFFKFKETVHVEKAGNVTDRYPNKH